MQPSRMIDTLHSPPAWWELDRMVRDSWMIRTVKRLASVRAIVNARWTAMRIDAQQLVKEGHPVLGALAQDVVELVC
eukprot:1205414-Prymnesium_polylepis.2